MITPFQRFTKVYETLTREKRHATDHAQICTGLASSQDLTRIYIYIYTVRSSATDTTKAHNRARTAHNIDLFPRRGRAPRPPCGSRLARDAWQLSRCHGSEHANRWEPASYAKSQRKITAVLHDRRAPPCFKTDISKM